MNSEDSIGYGTNMCHETGALLPFKLSSQAERGERTHQKNYHTSVLSLPILMALIYIGVLGRSILHELRQQNSSTQNWSNIATANLAPQIQSPNLLLRQTIPKPNQTTKLLIIYIPDDEGQYAMASKIAEGARMVDDDFSITLETVTTATFDQVLDADAVILGSSVENGNTHPLLQDWINRHWDLRKSDELSNTIGAAFVTAGGISAGQESTLQSLIRAMMIFRMIVVGGNTWQSAFGASAITAEAPFVAWKADANHDVDHFEFPAVCYQDPEKPIHSLFLEKAYGLGVRVATLARRLQCSSCV